MKKRNTTLNDIANALNVAVSTVSRALQDNPRISKETRKIVRKTAEKLNYQPNVFASNLRKGKGNTIGVIIPRINRGFFSNAIGGIERVAQQYGYNVIISQTHENYEMEVQSVKALMNARVDGIIMSLATQTDTYNHIEHIIKQEIPLVFFDRICEEFENSKVFLDDHEAGFMVTEHLIKNGCKKIAHFGGPDYINIYRDRKKGYITALEKYNLPVIKKLIFSDSLTKDKGELIAKKWLSNGDIPDGIFAASDFSALGALLVLKENGIKIPKDLCIAGISNESFTALISPSLTTVEQYSETIGKTAAEICFEQINNKTGTVTKNVMIMPKLIIRESTMRNL